MNIKTFLKRQDKVEVQAGKDKGKVGKIIKVIPNENKVIVEKINISKKHFKPRNPNQQSGILEKESPIHISNVMLLCSKCSNPTRIKFNRIADGSKIRTCLKCNEAI